MAFSKFWLDDLEKKKWGGGLITLQFFGYLKWPLELLILFRNVFISNKYK